MQVDLLMYCFQESLPDSLPPPVSFSPPNAPPISAPEVPILQLTKPQSLPVGPTHLKRCLRFFVKSADESPCGTSLFQAIASSSVLNLKTYRIGAKISSATIGASWAIATIVGSTKFPPLLATTLPPNKI